MTHDELDRLEKLMAIIAIGVSVSLKRGAVSISEAEQLLYSPRTFEVLKSARADKTVLSIIFSGTELENIARLLPDNLEKELTSLSDSAIAFLLSKNEINLCLPKWYEVFFGNRKVNG
ncbi:DUF3969 family protein [Methylogaea oryzae]|uniref:Uncharacterized protein n=1 Tax=Methylogaea oryzae TaxID=1295382 RepID=A0A8D4VPS9_9GAMM|nr:DUF3969 family protein [Methylogaea oryzae]BBL71810.1 hypothetical protein MoryE10_24160 [Methylogaea oryzae]